ncbi:organic cation transporter protein [Lingula anatina]|uniref:Organic cation transporter protein n=1 Tax=Lingula anatina TaxID=7574 RepID=A0A1S3KEY8_LINAN|nr:organic cation transporter protein [Lingula anatina]|eukprot:XP_013421062.1 organic cation transporter protein [Lingula anatina]
MAQFDDLLLEVGEIGWYQLAVSVIIFLGWSGFGAFSMMILMFIGIDPGWTCADRSYDNVTANWNSSYSSHLTTESSAMNSTGQDVPVDTTDLCKECSSYDFKGEYSSIVTEWELVCNKAFISDTITSVQMAGVLVGYLLFGQLSDMYGRKKAYFVAFTCGISVGVAQAFTTSWIVFATCRFASGLFTGGTMVVGTVYGLEYLGPKYRHILTTLGFWPTFSLVLLAMAYYIHDWHHLLLATSIPGFAFIAAWWFLPESPRWLLSKGRFGEVSEIVKRIAKRNKKPQPDMAKFIMEYKIESSKVEQGVKYGFWDLFRTPTLTKQTLIFTTTWFSMSFIWYGIAFNVKNLPGNRFVNAAVNFATGYFRPILLIFLLRWFGRKTIVIACYLTAAVVFIPIVVIYTLGKSDDLWIAITVLSTIGSTAVDTAWSVSGLIINETYPTSIRNIGMGLASMCDAAGGILSPQMAYFSTFWEPIPYVLSCILALVCVLVNCFIDETKNKAMVDAVPDREWCLCFSRRKENNYKLSDKECESKL